MTNHRSENEGIREMINDIRRKLAYWLLPESDRQAAIRGNSFTKACYDWIELHYPGQEQMTFWFKWHYSALANDIFISKTLHQLPRGEFDFVGKRIVDLGGDDKEKKEGGVGK